MFMCVWIHWPNTAGSCNCSCNTGFIGDGHIKNLKSYPSHLTPANLYDVCISADV